MTLAAVEREMMLEAGGKKCQECSPCFSLTPLHCICSLQTSAEGEHRVQYLCMQGHVTLMSPQVLYTFSHEYSNLIMQTWQPSQERALPGVICWTWLMDGVCPWLNLLMLMGSANNRVCTRADWQSPYHRCQSKKGWSRLDFNISNSFVPQEDMSLPVVWQMLLFLSLIKKRAFSTNIFFYVHDLSLGSSQQGADKITHTRADVSVKERTIIRLSQGLQ